MKLSETVKPISYLKAHASEIVRDIADNRTTYVITLNGAAKAVVQDMASFEQTKESLTLLKMLAQSTKSLQERRYKPLNKAFTDIASKARKRS